MDKHIEELVYQAKELGNMLYKTTQEMQDQLGTLGHILTELEVYNNPSTVTPKDYGVEREVKNK